jgi:hypothetical protein
VLAFWPFVSTINKVKIPILFNLDPGKNRQIIWGFPANDFQNLQSNTNQGIQKAPKTTSYQNFGIPQKRWLF